MHGAGVHGTADGELIGVHGSAVGRGHGSAVGRGAGSSAGDGGASGRGDGVDVRRNIVIPRQHLRQLLFERLDEGTVRWNCTVVGVEDRTSKAEEESKRGGDDRDGGGGSGGDGGSGEGGSSGGEGSGGELGEGVVSTKAVSVRMKDGTLIEADLLVGADGIRSVVRQYVKECSTAGSTGEEQEREGGKGRERVSLSYVGTFRKHNVPTNQPTDPRTTIHRPTTHRPTTNQ